MKEENVTYYCCETCNKRFEIKELAELHERKCWHKISFDIMHMCFNYDLIEALSVMPLSTHVDKNNIMSVHYKNASQQKEAYKELILGVLNYVIDRLLPATEHLNIKVKVDLVD